MKKASALSLVAISAFVVLGTAGCTASQTTYGSADEVAAAFTEAGGQCENTEAMPSFNEDYGIYGLNCESGDAVLWFDGDEGKTQWLSLLEGTSESYVEGVNWLIMTNDTELVTSSMGGKAAQG